jgi:MoaA/NifB/PqqE/SkfB family radical SAM enzyme
MNRDDGDNGPAAYTNIDFDHQPFLVIWEATQACDLACVHCRACAQPSRNPLELSTSEAKRLIEDVAELQTPLFVISGAIRSSDPTFTNSSGTPPIWDCGPR